MTHMRLRNLFRILALAAALLLGAGMTTTASAAQPSKGQTLLQKVLTSKDQKAAYLALDSSDRAAFNTAFKQLTPTVTKVSSRALTTAEATALGLKPIATKDGASATAAGVGPNETVPTTCWSYYYTVSWNDFFILNDGKTWFQLNWCAATTNAIWSWSVSHVGGQGESGVSYKGVIAHDALISGNQIRAYEEYDFGFYGFVDANPCIQIRGAATGTETHQNNCDLG